MRRAVLAVLAAAFLAAGCTTGRYEASIVLEGLNADPRHVGTASRMRADPHTGVTTVVGPEVLFYNGMVLHEFWLRGTIDPRNPKIHNQFQIVVRGRFERRVYLKQAYSGGEKIRSVLVDAERVCGGVCTWRETVAIPLSEADMERLSGTGFVFEIVGRRDQLVVRVPAGHFGGFLAAFRQYRDG